MASVATHEHTSESQLEHERMLREGTQLPPRERWLEQGIGEVVQLVRTDRPLTRAPLSYVGDEDLPDTAVARI